MKTVYEDYEVVKWGCQADWKFCEHDPGFSNENPIKPAIYWIKSMSVPPLQVAHHVTASSADPTKVL